MPTTIQQAEQRHTEALHDIISAPPSWLLRWGITLFFCVLLLIVALAALIRYPDLVKTQLKVNSANAPKPVVAKTSGTLFSILVAENQTVAKGHPLAYLESTASHGQVLQLLEALRGLQSDLFSEKPEAARHLNPPQHLQLGELQGAYQHFYQAYLLYKATVSDGFYLRKRTYLERDLAFAGRQKKQLLAQKELQEKDHELARQEYAIHQELTALKVEAPMELRREESKFLAKQFPLHQTAAALLANSASFSAKEKEILELDNQINEEKLRFIQALNTLVSETENWKNTYVLSAPQAGKVAFAGTVQENQYLIPNQEVFYLHSGNTDFFGEMAIPQYNMGKVKEGQEVLIKLRSYPYEEYGVVRGRITAIAEVPLKDSVFLSKVSFGITEGSSLTKPVQLKNGMMADAEIITEDASLLGRLMRIVTRIARN
jgi:multidrug efflux pump subunit AcrA (membrane-fusion protein)